MHLLRELRLHAQPVLPSRELCATSSCPNLVTVDLIELQLILRVLHRSRPVDSVAQRLDPKDEGGCGDEADGDSQRNAKEQASERSACRLG